MNMLLLFLIIPHLILRVESLFYKSNETDLSKCTIYYSRYGSTYKDFFEINQQPQNDTLLDFHISVLAPSDAHILLAPSNKVEKDDPVYEIVIGAGGNSFSDIRRMQKSDVKATKRTSNLLSGLDVQSFWIHISKDGVIDVGKEGEELGFLSWIDPDPLPLKVFSLSTWNGVEAKWFFDCPREAINATHLERPLTPLEKLRKDLLTRYDPYVRPVAHASNITLLGLQLSTNIITLNEYKSQLKYSGAATLNWNDEKLKWNASDYSGIEKIHIFRREIWVPNLHLFNSVDDGNNILEDTMLVVNSTGYVNWMTTINLLVWCNPRNLGNWPRDEHTCEIVLGFYNDFDNMQLAFRANQSSFATPYSSGWHISEVYHYSNMGWTNSSVRNLSNFDPPILSIYITMRRISNSYTLIGYSPFVVIAASLLITFWSSPFGKIKIALASFQLILATIMLIMLSILIPIHSKLVPNLVLLYSYSMVSSLICIIIEIIVINFSRLEHKTHFPQMFKKILLSFSLKIILCLPEIKQCERYGSLSESRTKLNDNPQTMWILLGIVIDRIAFFVYLGLVVYAFCITY